MSLQVADWLAQYGVDLEVYQYWLAKYYDGAWYTWYQEQYLPTLTTAQDPDTTAQEGAATAGDLTAQYAEPDAANSAQTQQPAELAELPQDAQPQPEFESQASAAMSTMAVQGSMFPDTDLLGGESPPAEQTSAVATTADLELESDAQLDSAESTQPMSSEEAVGAPEDFPLTFALGGELPLGELPQQTQDDSEAFTELATQEPTQGMTGTHMGSEPRQDLVAGSQLGSDEAVATESTLGQEDSFLEDQARPSQAAGTPTKGENPFCTCQQSQTSVRLLYMSASAIVMLTMCLCVNSVPLVLHSIIWCYEADTINPVRVWPQAG